MAVLSDVDFRTDHGKAFSIEGFDESLLGPNSYDLPLHDFYEVTDERIKADVLEEHRRLGGRGIEISEYVLPDIPSRSRRKITGQFRPKRVYVARCPKIEVGDGLNARIIPRSGAARNAVHGFNPAPNGWVVLVSYAFAEVPDDAVQLLIFEEGTKPVSAEEMREACEAGELFFSNPRFLSRDRTGYVPMHFKREVGAYTGGPLGNGNNSSKFSRNRAKSMFEFRLGITEEGFGTGPKYILWMASDQGNIYPNAPLCHANVAPQQHTLEVVLSPEEAMRIINGRKPQYACSVRAYRLRTPATKTYNGSYTRQREPQPKI